jgi:hypothetical protein
LDLKFEWEFLQKAAAKKPNIIAPYKPAIAPAPLATPKAKAKGRATTAAVTPAKISFFTLFKGNS